MTKGFYTRILSLGMILFMWSQVYAQPVCDLVPSFTYICDDNDTPCDPNDDFYEVRITASNDGQQGSFMVESPNGLFGPGFYDGLPISLGFFDAGMMGPTYCGRLYDTQADDCEIDWCTDMLFPCSDTFPILEVREVICNDNRTANDVSDDFYTVSVFARPPVTGWPHTYELDADGQIFSGLTYNKLERIIVPASGKRYNLILEDLFDSFCGWYVPIGPLEPCSTPCNMMPQVLDYVCNDNGTPDPSDDFYIVTLTATAVEPSFQNRYTVKSGLLPPIPLTFGDIHQVVIPARGQTEFLVFSDSYYTDCNATIEIGPLDHCSVFCETEVDSLSFICDNNGTDDTPNDDFYEICMIVSDTMGGSGYTIQIGGDRYGPFDYDVVECFELPADGSEPRLNIRDTDFPQFCSTFRIIGPLDPCSFPCDLVVNSLVPNCNDNGTTDPSDDFYEITVNVDHLQGTSTDSFTVNLDGTIFGNFPYNEDNTFTWPADGQIYEIYIEDILNSQNCNLLDTIGPLDPCSSVCELDIQVTNIECDNNGTGLDPGDDTYTFDLTVNGTNVGTQWRADDPGMTTAPYGATRSFGPYPISGGNQALTITDVLDPFCRETIEISPPSTCSDSCVVEILDFEIGPCDDNNTGPDKTDDFFFVDLLVDGQNVSGVGTYYVIEGGNQLGPYVYGVTESVGPLPATGNNIVIIIRDTEFGYCETSLVVSQDPCSDCFDTADAGSDQVITCKDNQVVLNGSASSPGTYNWEGPGGRNYSGQNPIVGEPGTYILTVTFAKGCTATDRVEVTRDTQLPVADPGANQELTCVVDSVTLGGSSTSTGPNILYEWRDVNNNIISDQLQITVGLPGTYCLQAIDTLLECESAVNCVTVTENREAPQANILVNPDDAFDCRVDSILLSLDDPTNAQWYWEKNTIVYSSDTLWVTDTGRVFVTLTDTITGCTTTLDIVINSLVDYPVINLARPDTITCMQETVTIDGRNSQTGPSIFYQWYDLNLNPISGATGRQLNVNDPGTYIFEARDTSTGCVNLDTITVGENRFYHTADAGPDKIIKCDSTTIVLNAGNSTQKNDISYTWRGLGVGGVIDGQGTLFPEVDGKGQYVLTVRDDISGCESYDTVFVDRAFPPSLDFVSVKNETCGGDELGAINVAGISGIRPFTYELNGYPVTETRFDSLKPGLFFFRVTDSLGCQTDTLLEVKEGNYLNRYNIEGDTFIYRGDSTTLKVDIDLPEDQVDQVYWSEEGSVFCFRCYEITVKPDTTTVYNFRLIDINGCEIAFDFVVKVQDKNEVFVPNIFTPNEDTENEVLHVFGKHLVRIDRMMIFNRWGEKVFQGFNLPPGPVWDGKWNGEYHVPAVLAWVIDATFEDGTQKQFTGSVTLLR
ncbi:MAG: gliding motility-associated C-terminal domain-containing protein [Saprospiraceae bacterium]|nr:gliding motility-associated C-terminal domain-containing protein [Saprospiraceae bacterium]